MVEEEQLELVKVATLEDLVNPMVPEMEALVNLEIDAPIAVHHLHRNILSDYYT